MRGRDLKSSELNCISSKLEFLWVENDAVLATDIKPMGCLVEAFLNGIRPQQCIVNALCLVGYIGDDLIVAPGITIS
jgi:hypothetical protein